MADQAADDRAEEQGAAQAEEEVASGGGESAEAAATRAGAFETNVPVWCARPKPHHHLAAQQTRCTASATCRMATGGT